MRDDKDPVRLRPAGADLGVLLSRTRADRTGQTCLFLDRRAQLVRPLLHVFRARPDQVLRLHERLVDGQLLHHVHIPADDLEHPPRRRRVDRPARGHQHRFRSHQARRPVRRHRRVRPILARLVARAGDHSSAGHSRHQYWTPFQRRPGQLLAGRVERIHVDVQHPAVHVHHCAPPGPPCSNPLTRRTNLR